MRIRRAAPLFSVIVITAWLTTGAALAPAVALAAPPMRPSHPSAASGSKAAAPAKSGKKGGKHGGHPAARKAGEPGEPDEAIRRVIAGTAGHLARESPELRAMRELDRALFPAPSPAAGAPWIAEGTPLIDRGEPEVIATGMPPSAPLVSPVHEPVRDLSWLRQLAMPDIPVRWDARVVRYLEFYRNNPHARSMVAGWLKKSGRYGGAIRHILRESGLPEDIVWLALVESGFDPTIQSPAGAAGLWQFMPEGARIYGLTVDRWIDERLDPERSTVAAARYLADLHTRFGSWELAFAAYNMGYGGLMASIRKYNTNDFWELSRLEAGMPLETALYVPKIVAMAIVARNRAVFGLDDTELDPAASFDKISVRPGVSLQSVALAAGASVDQIAELNPQLTASRAPPAPRPPEHLGERHDHVGRSPAALHDAPHPGDEDAGWTVRVPAGAGSKAAKSLPKFAEAEAKVERYVVRWGESVDDIAARRHTTRGALASLNGLHRDESLRPGTVLLLPAEDPFDPFAEVPASKGATKPAVVVPARAVALDREGSPMSPRRVFYRVIPGDTLRDVAAVFGVTTDEICGWNAIDPGASLHDGMVLQIYPPPGPLRADVLVLEEKDAHPLLVGSPEFFTYFEGQRGRTRVELTARQGDTWRLIAHRYGLTVGQLERINGRGRSTALNPGDKLVVYVPSAQAPATAPASKPGKETADDKAPEAVVVTKPGGPASPLAEGATPRDESVVKSAAMLVPVGLPANKAPTMGAPGPATVKGEAAAPR